MASALDMYLKKNKKMDPYAGKKSSGKKKAKGKPVMDDDMDEDCEVETVTKKSKKRAYLKD